MPAAARAVRVRVVGPPPRSPAAHSTAAMATWRSTFCGGSQRLARVIWILVAARAWPTFQVEKSSRRHQTMT
eukprot:4639865-Pleurochrysis_carterae.AAC.2